MVALAFQLPACLAIQMDPVGQTGPQKLSEKEALFPKGGQR